MINLLIVGAGAIGRGYVPWETSKVNLFFFDNDIELVDKLNKNKKYLSFMSYGDRLEEKEINLVNAFSDTKEIDFEIFDIAIICVGPRNIFKLDPNFKKLKCPIYSLENDHKCVFDLRNILENELVYFGIPDVITSFTASPESLAKDQLSIHTENGTMYFQDNINISDKIRESFPSTNFVNEKRMIQEWDAKLYLHNTPHCIAAYLGHLHGCTYLHEALAKKEVQYILDGVISEVLHTLKIETDHDHRFMEWYAKKEISRFSNTLLFDPVRRVAREPLRKLEKSGRLIGILKMALEAGVYPEYLLKGICAGLKYDHKDDKDYKIVKQIHNIGVKNFLEIFIGLDPESIESNLIEKEFVRGK